MNVKWLIKELNKYAWSRPGYFETTLFIVLLCISVESEVLTDFEAFPDF